MNNLQICLFFSSIFVFILRSRKETSFEINIMQCNKTWYIALIFCFYNYNSNYNEAPALPKVCTRTTNSLGNFSLAAKSGCTVI